MSTMESRCFGGILLELIDDLPLLINLHLLLERDAWLELCGMVLRGGNYFIER
jgi:hypothetical protein